ncbi:DUF4097 family beta strand repeat-containing protein [Paenibacillus sp. MBLB4367]|uniref:DUF4097 family beta strand repeat-containing protein n=1 Tax=Paenibacillus sp. MBLB4367 TaxID=3384767 RepID=UPI00390838A4
MRFPLKLFAFIGLAFLIIGIGGLAYLFEKTDGFVEERSEFKHEQTIGANGIQHLSVEADYADIIILPGKDSDIHVSFHGSALKSMQNNVNFTAKKEPGDTAVIQALTHKKFNTGIDIPQLFDLINGELRSKLEITVPETLYRTIQVKSNVGSVRIESLQAQTVKITTDVGAVSVNGLKSESLKVSTETGAMNIKDVSGAVALEGGIGAINLWLKELNGNVSIKSDVGAIGVKLPAPSAMRLDLKSDIGSSTVDLPNMTFTSNEDHDIQGSIGSNGPLLKIRSDIGGIAVGVR